MTATELLRDVTSWASHQASVRAVLLVGSYARGAARPDSDIDLVIVAENPAVYTCDPGFAAQFGAASRVSTEDWGKVISIRAFYEGGPEVEFGLTSPDWLALPLDEGTRQVLSDGYQVLVDKDGDVVSPYLDGRLATK